MIIQSTDMTTYGKHEGSGQAVRERGDDLCFYRGTIPTLDENKCACMHGQKLNYPGGWGLKKGKF